MIFIAEYIFMFVIMENKNKFLKIKFYVLDKVLNVNVFKQLFSFLINTVILISIFYCIACDPGKRVVSCDVTLSNYKVNCPDK